MTIAKVYSIMYTQSPWISGDALREREAGEYTQGAAACRQGCEGRFFLQKQ